jgi:hypothetical protein
MDVSIMVIIQNVYVARHWWLMPVILATWEAEIWRITVGGQPRQIVREIPPSPK